MSGLWPDRSIGSFDRSAQRNCQDQYIKHVFIFDPFRIRLYFWRNIVHHK
jgi:hypothetical protein